MAPSARLRALARDLEDLPARTVADAVELVQTFALEEARRATGGSGRMSGVNRGARLRAAARTRSSSDGAAAELSGVPAGGWAILTGGTGRHTITPDRGEVLAGSLEHPVSVGVRHPGQRARGAWRQVVRRSEPAVSRLFIADVERVVR